MAKLLLLGAGFSSLIGCVVADVDLPFDEDEDGLLLEEDYGTDPENPDSDGDNHLDGDEVSAGHSPTDPADHPYFGGWTVDLDCRDSIVATGDAVGDVMADFELTDQYGETLRLYDFCGRTVYLVAAGFT
jgi:hypothetical protein